MHIYSTYFLTSSTQGSLKGAYKLTYTYIEEDIFFHKRSNTSRMDERLWETWVRAQQSLTKDLKIGVRWAKKLPIHSCLTKAKTVQYGINHDSWPPREKQNHSRMESRPQSTQSLEWPLSGVHSIMMVNHSSLHGEGGECMHTIPLSLYISTITSKVVVQTPAEKADTPPCCSSTPLCPLWSRHLVNQNV